jgi:hypothetical protein
MVLATGRVSNCRNSQIANRLEPFIRPSEKLRELPYETVFGTSGVLANSSLEIEDPFRRCSVQKQNTATPSIIKIQYFLNSLADRAM